MPGQLTVMIEGQEGLTWERWQALARTVEDAGYAGLFRSDHLTGLFGHPRAASLDAWASLTWLASHTRRIRFGPMVCPLTFYHPALLARRAAAVATLSGGRLDLGIVVGGRGERRTLRVVAAHADEWNVTRVTPEEYAVKCRVLEQHCRVVGRDP